MPEHVQEVISALLLRLRDPGGLGTTRALTLDILSRTQQIYNESLRLKLTEVSFPTLPLVQFYPLTADLGISSVSHVKHRNRDLFKVTFDDLLSLDRQWHRATSDRFECFIPLGYTHVLLWPALTQADTVALVGPTLTVPLVSENQDLELSQERTPLLIQLTELVLLNRLNDQAAFKVILTNFQQFLPREALKESRGSHA